MFPTGFRTRRRATLVQALAGTVLTLAAAALVLPSAQSVAAPAAPPRATAEPTISGRAEQGRTLSASRGSWTGTGPISFAFRWVRCPQDGGRADGSNCVFVQGATSSRYQLGAADVGFRMRVRVTGTNSEGSQTVASNPTATVVGSPVNSSIPLVVGTPLVDSVLTVQPGTWSGRQPISFSYGWLRCNSAGGECVAIGGANGRTYRLTASDVNHRVRCNVTARNAVGSTTVLSSESGLVSVPLPPGAIRLPNGAISIPATSVPADGRLIVSQVGFTPNPVASRQRQITVRVRVTDNRGYVVRDAIVFVRSTPRVTTGSRLLTAQDGVMTTRLLPLDTFPLKRNGRVQFFVKAYRSGDPTLGGVAGYRLVQVKTAPAP
jgi:hypothetical protein